MSGAPGIFDTPAPRYFAIDPGRPFLDDLARALHKALLTDDPLALADALIYVPTRRAARALAEAFVNAAPAGRASLLPQIKPLGDIDEDEIALFAGEPEDEIALPPAVSPLERTLTLARLTARRDRVAFDGQENWPAAIAAARELSKLLDSFHAEEISFDALERIAPTAKSLAAHWKDSLDFLEIVTRTWPAHLAEIGRMDPAERRAKLIAAQAARWAKDQPDRPIVVAGTTGSAPAVARLMRAAASLPRGCVVLPGLDRTLAEDARAWEAVDDPHPQAGLKALMAALTAEPADVRVWPGSGAASARGPLLSLALRPAEATDDWLEKIADERAKGAAFGDAIKGLSLIEAADEESEAAAVALMMREALDTPGRTAMLVTPDRGLSRRAAAKMRRWGVTVDDSAGLPFANSPCGTYLRLVARWLEDVSDPAAVMALLRHPLCGLGLGADTRRRAVNAFDVALRGLRPAAGVEGLSEKLAHDNKRAEIARSALDALKEAVAGWPDSAGAPFADRFAAHIAAAEKLAGVNGETGAARLWRGEDGEAGAALFAELAPLADGVAMDGGGYAEIFTHLIAGAAVRRRAGAHPRLAILGPLEARLMSADLVIVGGLNEGVWPVDAGADPFLSRPMRAAAGLPSLERRVGLSAHDFAQLAAAPEVALTRAARAGGAPSKPSRWIVRLKNILNGVGALSEIDRTEHFRRLAEQLDKPDKVEPAEPPRPRPPVAARPRELFVTRIEKWLRDPYGIYARYVLGLRKLDELGEEFDQRYVGLLLHKVFEDYCKTFDAPRDDAEAQLRALLERHGPAYGMTPALSAFWGARFADALSWYADWDRERRERGVPAVIEGVGAWTFETPGGPFELSARADRIDKLASGAVAIFDYKSGVLPTLKQTKSFNLQLPLTALIAANGGFNDLGATSVESFHYVKTLGRKNAKSVEAGVEGADAEKMMAEAEEGLRVLIAHYDDPSTFYPSQPRSEYMDEYGDYDLLARRREWSESGGEAEGGE
ncbi:MAG: double-strand break repair protein AddB [Parvularculaceae bacterium]